MSSTASAVRADASATELVEAIERHQTELSVRWTAIQDGDVVDGPGFVRTINPGIKVAFANNVHRVRLSVDYRFQGVSQPVESRSLLPHFNRMSWDEIYQGWEQPELEYYWKRHELAITEFTRKYHEAAGR